MRIKTKDIKTFYPTVIIRRRRNRKYDRIHGNGEKTKDSTENCVEDMEQKSLPHSQKAIRLIVVYFAGIMD